LSKKLQTKQEKQQAGPVDTLTKQDGNEAVYANGATLFLNSNEETKDTIQKLQNTANQLKQEN